MNNTNDISSNKSTQIEKEETSSSSLVFGYLNLFSDGVVSFLVSIINFTAAFLMKMSCEIYAYDKKSAQLEV